MPDKSNARVQTEKLPGIVTPTGDMWSGVAATLVAQRGLYGRFVVQQPFTMASVAYAVSTFATNDDPVEIGIYSAAGARLVTTGSTSGKLNTSNGVKSVSLAYSFAPGVYYTGFLCATVGGTGATVIHGTLGSLQSYQLFGTAVPNALAATEAGLASLPSTMTPAFGSANTCIQLALRTS